MELEMNVSFQSRTFQNYPTRKSKTKLWVPTKRKKMKSFFGLINWIGLMKLHQSRDYWSQSFLYANNMKKIMSRNRFEELLSTVHFNNNQVINMIEVDQLHKI